MYLAIVITIAIFIYCMIDRICECIEYLHTEDTDTEE